MLNVHFTYFFDFSIMYNECNLAFFNIKLPRVTHHAHPTGHGGDCNLAWVWQSSATHVSNARSYLSKSKSKSPLGVWPHKLFERQREVTMPTTGQRISKDVLLGAHTEMHRWDIVGSAWHSCRTDHRVQFTLAWSTSLEAWLSGCVVYVDREHRWLGHPQLI